MIFMSYILKRIPDIIMVVIAGIAMFYTVLNSITRILLVFVLFGLLIVSPYWCRFIDKHIKNNIVSQNKENT